MNKPPNSNKTTHYWKKLYFSIRYILKNKDYNDTNYWNINKSKVPRKKILKQKDFENINLSYLTEEDFEDVTIEDCNFHNTGLNIDFNKMIAPSTSLYNVKFSKEMKISPTTYIDIKTLDLNSDYPFTDQQVLIAIMDNIKQKKTKRGFFKGNIYAINYGHRETYSLPIGWTSKNQYENAIKNYIAETIVTLRNYNRNNLADFLEKYLQHDDINDVFAFINCHNQEIDFFFKDIHFTTEDFETISQWRLWYWNKFDKRKVIFENCTFDTNYGQIQESFKKNNSHIFKDATFNNCNLSNDSYANNGTKKVNRTSFSTNTTAYIKIGSECNGKCSFCKNQAEQATPTDVDKIIETLCDSSVFPHLNQIYFSGGEPSLYLNEISKILESYFNKLEIEKPSTNSKWYIFTNGGGSWENIYNLIRKYNTSTHQGRIILSRHAIDDIENKKITGLNYSLDQPHLKRLLNSAKVSFSLTCSEENMKEHFLEDYFNFGKKLGVKEFIIQSLEERTNTSNFSVEEYFKEFEQYLVDNGFTKKDIVSSSYFDLSLYKKNKYTVSLKRHFDQSQLQEKFQGSTRHSYELGIDSNGDLYNDYQLTKKITLPNKKV